MTKDSSKNAAGKAKKPSKPYEHFPLFAHATGRWAKKIRGKLHYFGPWGDWEAALELYEKQAPDLHAGRVPRDTREGVALVDLLEHFMASKDNRVASGEITKRTFDDYHRTGKRLLAEFGKERFLDDLHPQDFEKLRASLSKTMGPVALGNEVTRVRVIFKYAYDSHLVEAPIRMGSEFKRPSAKTLRLERSKRGLRMFEAKELRRLFYGAALPLRAMILLGANCGFGNSDCAALPLSALDLKAGWVNFPRPKTGIERRCPLWEETVEALRDWLKVRPTPTDEQHAELVFITRHGSRFSNEHNADCAISKETTKLLKSLGLHRRGLGFYALRHGFETIAGGSRDQVATDYLMGHSKIDMATVYRERIEDERLVAVVNHVHAWLFPRPTVG